MRGGLVELRHGSRSFDPATVSCRSDGIVVALVELPPGARVTLTLPPGPVQLRGIVGATPWGRDVEILAGERIEVVIEP